MNFRKYKPVYNEESWINLDSIAHIGIIDNGKDYPNPYQIRFDLSAQDDYFLSDYFPTRK